MEDVFITDIHISKVRHLENIDIHLSDKERKHLILTGKNGSGKTSVLKAIFEKLPNKLNEVIINSEIKQNTVQLTLDKLSKALNDNIKIKFNNLKNEVSVAIQAPISTKAKLFSAKRNLVLQQPKGPGKIQFDEKTKKLNSYFLQQLVNVRYNLLEAKVDEDSKTEKSLQLWFDNFKKLLELTFDDKDLSLQFDKNSFNYNVILSDGRKFNFHQLSDGYSSIIDIVSEILMSNGDIISNSMIIEGIVLIDEIETHLHIDLQKKILPFLTKFFPKIQFIVTTHSPFVLTSIDNAVIFDLEKQERIEDLSGYSLEGVVRGYFGADEYSIKLKEQIQEYEKLLKKGSLSIEEQNKLNHLRFHFKELPKFLAPELQVKLQQLELEELTQ